MSSRGTVLIPDQRQGVNSGMTKPFVVGRLCNLQRKGSESRPLKFELIDAPNSLSSFLCWLCKGGPLDFRHI
jgi:hypothetical protein